MNQHILASLENGYPTTAPHADDPIWQEAMDDLTPRERELMGWLLLHPDATVTWDDDGLWLNGQLCRSLEAALQALRKNRICWPLGQARRSIAGGWVPLNPDPPGL